MHFTFATFSIEYLLLEDTMKKQTILLICLLTFSLILVSKRDVFAAELSQENENNYRIMGMSEEDIQRVKEELKLEESDNAITETERKFYIDMGIKEEDLDNMISDSLSTDNEIATRVHGTYPREKGIILVTKDKVAGVVPLGHAAIVYNHYYVIESNPGSGVHKGDNNWWKTRNITYGLKVHTLSQYQREQVADWCSRKQTLPYNWNFYDVNTRSKFYCSQLVWAGFKDKYNVDLNGGQYGQAIYPPEIINSGYVLRIYIKGDGY